MKITKNLYGYQYHGFKNNCNTFIFKDKICTLIDPGYEWNLNNLLYAMEKDGFKVRDIDLIVNTHTHPDHCEANQALVDMSGAKIAVHKMEDEYLRGKGLDFYRILRMKPPSFRVDFHLADKLSLGNTELKILHTPGHSPGSISLYWQQQKVLICGDLVFLGGVGRVDFPGGDAELLKRSIKELSKLEIEYILPGHGEIIKGKVNVKRNFDYCLKMMEVIF
jgi:glyoxylase-like metal-dependent hydrolase (beta-lactamase superfamily II)